MFPLKSHGLLRMSVSLRESSDPPTGFDDQGRFGSMQSQQGPRVRHLIKLFLCNELNYFPASHSTESLPASAAASVYWTVSVRRHPLLVLLY